eukprot:7508153-Pyramimonas_sp.AAC.1
MSILTLRTTSVEVPAALARASPTCHAPGMPCRAWATSPAAKRPRMSTTMASVLGQLGPPEPCEE